MKADQQGALRIVGDFGSTPQIHGDIGISREGYGESGFGLKLIPELKGQFEHDVLLQEGASDAAGACVAPAMTGVDGYQVLSRDGLRLFGLGLDAGQPDRPSQEHQEGLFITDHRRGGSGGNRI